jgi:hypothetical protein
VLFQRAADAKARASSAPSGILTIGESAGRESAGKESAGKAPSDAVICFVIEDGKVRFTVNLSLAGRQNLRVSSRLLGLASSVIR